MNTQMGDRIHDLRSYLGLSLKAFGEAIGFSGNHISRFEKNVFSPDERVTQKICDVFHVDPSYFTGEMPVEQAVQKVEVDTAGAGQRLKTARVEKRLSMWELSRRAGISQPQISMLESGKYQVRRKAAEKLAAALEVGVDWLLTGDESKKRFPADKAMVDWLWQHPEVRCILSIGNPQNCHQNSLFLEREFLVVVRTRFLHSGVLSGASMHAASDNFSRRT